MIICTTSPSLLHGFRVRETQILTLRNVNLLAWTKISSGVARVRAAHGQRLSDASDQRVKYKHYRPQFNWSLLKS